MATISTEKFFSQKTQTFALNLKTRYLTFLRYIAKLFLSSFEVESPVMVVGQIVNNHLSGAMSSPVVLPSDPNVGYDPNLQQLPRKGKQPMQT
eukprot:UN06669